MYKIAISGKANSGKNTTANIILQELAKIKSKEQLINEIVAFADPIKEIILKMFPQKACKDFLYGRSELRALEIPGSIDVNGNPLTYRQALIDIGTMARKYNPNVWVDCFDCTYKNILSKNNILKNAGQQTEALIVSDLRFKEELDYLKQENFYLIKIKRNKITKIDHASETQQDGFSDQDFNSILNNNGTMEDLRSQILNILPDIASYSNNIA